MKVVIDNMIQRGIIVQTLGIYSSGCGHGESVYNMFVGCAFYGSIWTNIYIFGLAYLR